MSIQRCSLGILPLLINLYKLVAPASVLFIYNATTSWRNDFFWYLLFFITNMLIAFTILTGVKFLHSRKCLVFANTEKLPDWASKHLNNLSVISLASMIKNRSLYGQYIFKLLKYISLTFLGVYLLGNYILMQQHKHYITISEGNTVGFLLFIFLLFYWIGYIIELSLKDIDSTDWTHKDRIIVSVLMLASLFLFGAPAILASCVIRNHTNTESVDDNINIQKDNSNQAPH